MHSLRILAVDDEPAVPRMYARYMRRCTGHRVTPASSISEALACLSEEPHDVAILDLVMETPVAGLELGREIRKRWPEMVIIILTANESMESAIKHDVPLKVDMGFGRDGLEAH